MIQLRLFLLISSIILACSGCGTRNKENPALEELAMVGAMAFDYIDESKIKITVIAPQPSSEAKKNTQVYSAEATLVKEALVEISAKSDRMVNLEQLRVVFFGEEFAEKGKVVEIVEYLYRDADVRETVRMGVVAGKASDVLEAEYPDKPNTNVYLNNLLEPTLFTAFTPFTDLHIFISDAEDPLISPSMPYLEVEEGKPVISEIAMFDGNNMIDKLKPEDGKFIQALAGTKKIAPSVIELDRDRRVLLEFISTDTKITSNADFNSPIVNIKLDFEGALGEYKGKERLDKDNNLVKLEHDIEDKMKKMIEDVIKGIQQRSADPIGLLEPLRMKYHGKWTDKMTDELLRKTKFDVVVDVRIVNIGALKK